ncbi:MAG: trypsin-like peptidase domain-containing protein [Armatimonadota bacterium]|nr:trypsin-like peptidase domain-containing protein [Armatimonadota bacterium]MDR7452222.1 trypsin-like peptidase domain-containing protein [Armatimonadota bacterium]MDR7466683.1 trypsin-like peptidase domain-containing protein [Armatimonadota bacterium]MDR7492843.1 trypsin-like peptidase domain-containing protein [Armatimonadota bacterium]MDR7498619.1 trypsin-like peptidase domain-containing protein [Armatimonadota bacterium]
MRWMTVLAILMVLAAPAPAQMPPAALEQAEQAVVQVSVVAESGGRAVRGSGSGIIIDPQGVILTANHVVARARQVEVALRDGPVLPARIIGTDPVYDVALIGVDPPRPLPRAPLGVSAALQPGAVVTALGRAPRRPGGPTSGGFLALDYETRPGVPLLRTLAPVWPGDSGGALLDDAGNVVGVIVALSLDGTVSMSVAIDAVKANLDALRAGSVRHPWLGIRGLTVTAALAEEIELAVRRGVLITEVIPGGPAAQAGLRGGVAASPDDLPRGGDVIVALDGRPTPTFGALAAHVLGRRIGDPVSVEFLRDGRLQTAVVILGERPGI